MNATAKWLMCGASLGLALSASWASAGSHSLAPQLSMLAIGANNDGDAEAEYLAKAREAMKFGRYEEASKLIDDAARLGVQRDPVTARFKDSPEKARADLSKLQGPKTPSSRFSAWPPSLNKQQPQMGEQPRDPFAARANDATIDKLSQSKGMAGIYLDRGRQALKQGDSQSAIVFHQKALAENATYAQGDYTPDMLAGELRAAGVDLSRLGPAAPRFGAQAMPEGDADLASRIPGYDRGVPGQNQPITSPDQLQPERNPLARGESQMIHNPNVAPQPNQFAAAPSRLPTVEANSGPSQQKQQAMQLMANARMALDRGDVANAHRMAEEAQSLRVPESEFVTGEKRPWELVLETSRALNRRGVNPGMQPVQQASGVDTAGFNDRGGFAVQQGMYNPAADHSRTVAAQATEAANDPQAGMRFFDAGMKAFAAGDREAAHKNFEQAWKYQHQLDPSIRSQLKDKLIALQTPKPERLPEGATSPLAQVDQKTELLRQQYLKEIQAEEAAADRLMKSDPDAAIDRMRKMRERIAASEMDPQARKQLQTFVDRRISDMDAYIKANRADIDLNNANRQVRGEIDREQQLLVETQTRLAELVSEFNKLLDEQRYHEAEVVAKQAREIAPQEPVVQNMIWQSNFVTQFASQMSIKERKDRGFLDQLGAVDESSIPFDDRQPYVINAKQWGELTRRRRGMMEQARRRMTPVEMEIQRSLEKQVEVNFVNRPLAEVMDTLGKMANVNIHLDPQGLHAEGVTSDTPVTLNLATPISLKSAMRIILEQLRLGYVIQNEVLQVTSQQMRAANLVTVVYNVGDLVIPIPNFTPSQDMGLASAIREGHNNLGYGPGLASGSMGLGLAASQRNSAINPLNLAQMGPTGSLGSSRPEQFMSGPGSLGGAAMADFDSLIDLVTSTVHPESWKEGGTGEGTIAPFPTNLSIVVSQTEEVHQAISDLLDQLRRLQDLQVTIEVRFITLNDNFFERIGVDFEFNIDDNSGGIGVLPDDTGPSVVVGLDPDRSVTTNRDIQFTQNSMGAAIPQFGGFDPASLANFGFAILSDIEVFFLLQAGTGDTRTNVLQAPKVTLFNGQQAVVSDTSQRPFVTSVVPVVGDFAAAHQPVITVLSEGTSLSVQAVVSADRRFVRLTLVPFFSQIGDVEEFTFTGKTTTNTGTAVIDPTDPGKVINDDAQTTTEGTTVQLPTFAFTTVTTTVSVPDGGTVLLGGIKRLSEGRTERGVPLLSKVPYASRLFKNVGIGRTTQSLMMMVTPRIIIQEEEEEKLGIDLGP